MSNKKYLISSFVALLVTTALVASLSLAAAPEDSESASQRGRGFDSSKQQNIQEMTDALESGNYDAWLAAVGDRPIVEKVTAENFAQFAEAHRLLMSGDKEGAQAIFDELGIKPFGPEQRRGGGEMMKGQPENFEAIQAALDASDYNAWLTAVGDAPITEKINEGNFSRFVEAHSLMQQSRSIMEELGVQNMGHRGLGFARHGEM